MFSPMALANPAFLTHGFLATFRTTLRLFDDEANNWDVESARLQVDAAGSGCGLGDELAPAAGG